MAKKYEKKELEEEHEELEEENQQDEVDLEQLQGVLKGELDDAQDFIDALVEDRNKATRY